MTKMAKVGDWVRFDHEHYGWCEPPKGTEWMKRGDILQVREVSNDCYRFVGLYYPHPHLENKEYKFIHSDFTLIKRQVIFDDIFNPTVKWVVDNESEE